MLKIASIPDRDAVRDNNWKIACRTTGPFATHCANNEGLIQNSFNATSNSNNNNAVIAKIVTCTYNNVAANFNINSDAVRKNSGPTRNDRSTPATASANARPAEPSTPPRIRRAPALNSPPARSSPPDTAPNVNPNAAIFSGNSPGNSSP
ncbi:hypothetical protein Vqi01_15400 [Micromonospora qiuiae]|uniref:Uncharacterized protein n=1 Tax=Micromonospora qiuiae TaxID=502268 RepID=A0ABQ4J895_9ACTN|nr:hypothetical protein Vqi01_15400 [Micromonospora qiuiae]